MSLPRGDKRETEIRHKWTCDSMFVSIVVMLMYLTPDMAVELVSYHVEHCHHRHVKKEEAHQASGAEVPKKGIHPNSN